jgi:hypothetical protein
MGFFDFLKDVGFEAPKEEPRRGTQFSSTDDRGSIATSPDGRILSNVERDAYNTRGDRRVDNTPPPDINMREVEPDRSEPQFLSGIDAFRAGTSMQGRSPVDIGIQPDRSYVPMSMVYGPNSNLKSYEFKGSDLPIPSPDDPLGYDFQNESGSIMGTPEYDLRRQFPVEQFRDNTAKVPPLGEPSQEVQELADELIIDAQRDFNFLIPPDQAIRLAKETINKRNANELAGTFSPDNRGITTLAGRGRNLQKGFEEAYGVDVANDPNKAMQARLNDPQYQAFLETQDSPMAKYVNMFGQKVLGYDDPFEMYKDTQATVARERGMEGQRQREEDRASRSRTQSTPLDPCEAGYTFDPSTQQCVPDEDGEESKNIFERNPQTMQEYLNENRPAGFSGNVPLGMYGRVGGEYKYFMNQGGGTAPRGGTGEVTGAGGPKDDLVGPFMLSNKEYVLPNEQIKMYGGGNYETGVKRLEQDRLKSLSNFA